MRNLTNTAIAKIFREFADKIETGTCDVDIDTLVEVTNKVIHIKMTAEQTADYLNVSRSTLTRMIADKRVPLPRKDKGGNKFWYQDEIDEYIAKYKKKYGLE